MCKCVRDVSLRFSVTFINVQKYKQLTRAPSPSPSLTSGVGRLRAEGRTKGGGKKRWEGGGGMRHHDLGQRCLCVCSFVCLASRTPLIVSIIYYIDALWETKSIRPLICVYSGVILVSLPTSGCWLDSVRLCGQVRVQNTLIRDNLTLPYLT